MINSNEDKEEQLTFYSRLPQGKWLITAACTQNPLLNHAVYGDGPLISTTWFRHFISQTWHFYILF